MDLYPKQGEAKGNSWWSAQFQFADKEDFLKPNLPTGRVY